MEKNWLLTFLFFMFSKPTNQNDMEREGAKMAEIPQVHFSEKLVVNFWFGKSFLTRIRQASWDKCRTALITWFVLIIFNDVAQ